MTTPQQPSGLNTPPFGQPSGPEYQTTQPIGAYRAQDFPAPAGVPPLGGPGAQPGGYDPNATLIQPAATTATLTATRPRRRGGVVVAAAALSAIIGAGAGIGSYAYIAGGSTGSVASPISVTTRPAANTPALDGTVSAAAERIEPSVVTISVQTGQGGGIGTGVVLDKNGHILTNDHVVSAAAQAQQSPDGQEQGQGEEQQGQEPQGESGNAATSISVTFDDGTTEKATIVGTSDTNDLAVIKVAASDKLVPATFAKSESLQVGQAVVAVGAPLGLSDTVTSGIVSNTTRPVRSGTTNDAVYLAVQTDAAINPGNSGGPLVDLNGDVAGINSSIASTGSDGSGGSGGNIGIGFAIPADVAVRVAGQLVETGKYANAALGVSVGGQDSQAVSTDGVVLQSVTADGAAAKAGLKEGDQVTKINDFSTTTADGLIAATRFYAPGTTVDVTYDRDGQTQTVKVTLGSA
ncbi:MAG TPA: trypsin-like peptidase domain-containing protein [Microlunatus sp.]|nr:trypsin-like peptidase domain-containing protein [Microlunatus sp.]